MRRSKIIENYLNGKQNIKQYDETQFIELPRNEFGEENETYNIILPMIENAMQRLDITKNDDVYKKEIIGKNGLVEKLMPYQNRYNKLKNKEMNYINRCLYPMLFVEDGSVDVDGLNDEGLTPGKILIYRQGAQIPELKTQALDKNVIEWLDNELLKLQCEMQEIVNKFELDKKKYKNIY